jgi:hypothetical protein
VAAMAGPLEALEPLLARQDLPEPEGIETLWELRRPQDAPAVAAP